MGSVYEPCDVLDVDIVVGDRVCLAGKPYSGQHATVTALINDLTAEVQVHVPDDPVVLWPLHHLCYSPEERTLQRRIELIRLRNNHNAAALQT